MNRQLKGLAASPGIAAGNAWIFIPQSPAIHFQASDNAEAEIEAFRHAQNTVEAHLQSLYEKVLAEQGEEEAEIFSSHIELLRDEEFEQDVLALMKDEQYSATRAVKEYLDQAAATMRALDDDYLKERAAEFEDLQKNLLLALNNMPFASLGDAPADTIIFAQDLSPSETAQLNPKNVRGFVLAGGGLTSHVAILARNIGLPAVMGISNVLEQVQNGESILLDGSRGEIIVQPDEATQTQFNQKAAAEAQLQAEYAALLHQPATTTDGQTIKLYSNIGSPKDLHLVEDNGSEGIGLFRSEFLFMSANSAPSEEAQYQAYKQAAEHLGERQLILRLADIGGDKPLPYLNFPHEENPFLGWRGVRIYDEMRHVFDAQIRAALRAAVHGNLQIMIPMVSNVDEILFVRREVAMQVAALQAEGKACNPDIKIGIMIETPAAVLIAPQLAKHADFFSIGTNDLTQYIIAADRGNTKISSLYDSLHPAVLRAMKMAVDAAHAAGIEIGVCGEMGGQIEATPFLVGMGFHELSVSGRGVPAVKHRIRQLSAKDCRALLEEALQLDDGIAVRQLLHQRLP